MSAGDLKAMQTALKNIAIRKEYSVFSGLNELPQEYSLRKTYDRLMKHYRCPDTDIKRIQTDPYLKQIMAASERYNNNQIIEEWTAEQGIPPDGLDNTGYMRRSNSAHGKAPEIE